MLASQIILPAIIFFILYKTFVSFRKKELSKNFTIIWILFWLLILFLIFRPNFSSQIAHLLGIGRGVDLALYTAVITLFYLIYKILVQLNKLDKKITGIVRTIALKNPHTQKGK